MLKASELSYESLVENGEKYQTFKRRIRRASKLSISGITNLVVNYEDSHLVRAFLEFCFKKEELFKGITGIDVVELQMAQRDEGYASRYLDTLIYGEFEFKEEEDRNGLKVKTILIDYRNGARKRKCLAPGVFGSFVNRTEVLTGKTVEGKQFKDKLLIIKNIDYCVDFCKNKPGIIDPFSLYIFDKFRDPGVKMGCYMLLVTNEPLKFPSKIRTIEFDPVDEYDMNFIIDSFIRLYEDIHQLVFNNGFRKEIILKFIEKHRFTYLTAADIFGESLSVYIDALKKNQLTDNGYLFKNIDKNIDKYLADLKLGF